MPFGHGRLRLGGGNNRDNSNLVFLTILVAIGVIKAGISVYGIINSWSVNFLKGVEEVILEVGEDGTPTPAPAAPAPVPQQT